MSNEQRAVELVQRIERLGFTIEGVILDEEEDVIWPLELVVDEDADEIFDPIEKGVSSTRIEDLPKGFPANWILPTTEVNIRYLKLVRQGMPTAPGYSKYLVGLPTLTLQEREGRGVNVVLGEQRDPKLYACYTAKTKSETQMIARIRAWAAHYVRLAPLRQPVPGAPTHD